MLVRDVMLHVGLCRLQCMGYKFEPTRVPLIAIMSGGLEDVFPAHPRLSYRSNTHPVQGTVYVYPEREVIWTGNR